MTENIKSQINELAEKGNQLVEQDRFDDAIETYKRAFALVPEPVDQWEESTWLLTALGETYWFSGQYPDAAEHLKLAMHCPGAIGNPFIHLRLGQVQYELGNLDRAADELTRAYMGAGSELFKNEDPKFLKFLSGKIKPSLGESTNSS